MRIFDGRQILYNLAFDLNKMLDNGQDGKAILDCVVKKIEFLKEPPAGTKIKW